MAKRLAVVDTKGDVINAVLVKDGSKWQPPARTTLIEHEAAGPGWRHENGEFIAPPTPDVMDEGEAE